MNCCVAKAVSMGPVAHFDLIASLRLNTLRWLEQKGCFLICSVLIMLLMERYGDSIFKMYIIPFRNRCYYYPHLHPLSQPPVLCILTVYMAFCEFVRCSV